jgi:DNA repair protein RadC
VGAGGKTALQLAEEILVSSDGLANLIQARMEELLAHKGIGEAKAAQIKAALELGRRLYHAPRRARVKILTPDDVAELIMVDLRHLDREHLRVICLDTKNQVVANESVSVGTLNSSLAHPRECFRAALRHASASVIFVHNHPSGDPSPSREDIELTKQLARAGELLGVAVLDHVIIGDGTHASLKERGVI